MPKNLAKGEGLAVSVPEAGRLLGLGRNSAYEAAAKGDIPTIRIGGRISCRGRRSTGCSTPRRKLGSGARWAKSPEKGLAMSAFRIINFRRIPKNSLRGVFDLQMTSGLIVRGAMLFEKNGKRWVGFPSKEWVKHDGIAILPPYRVRRPLDRRQVPGGGPSFGGGGAPVNAPLPLTAFDEERPAKAEGSARRCTADGRTNFATARGAASCANTLAIANAAVIRAGSTSGRSNGATPGTRVSISDTTRGRRPDGRQTIPHR